MALTATASQGFELVRYTGDYEVLHIPGDPGDTFTRGDQVVATVGEGVLDPGAANEGGIVGVVEKTVVCSASTTAMPKPRDFDAASDSSNALIPIRVNVPSGVPIYEVTFANQLDDTVADAGDNTAAAPYVGLTTGFAGDSYSNGALCYVYEGTGIGQVNVCAGYDDAGGNATNELIFHRAFGTALDTTSKIIVLAGEAVASRGVGFFNRCESADHNNVTVNQGADDGDWVIFMDFAETADLLKNLKVRVIPARYLLLA